MTDLAKGTNSAGAEELSSPMTIGVEAYISEDYARAERDRLWRRVWQQVGRVEELPEVGSYLTYDILDDSIIVVRTGHNEFHAHHNVCMHRGRRLIDTPRAPRTPVPAPESRSSAAFTVGPMAWTGRARTSASNRTGRERSPRTTPTFDRFGSTPGAAGCGSTWTPTASRWPITCSPPRRSSTRSGVRTCATSGANGLNLTATGRSRWKRSTRPTTSTPRTPSSTSSASSRGGRKPKADTATSATTPQRTWRPPSPRSASASAPTRGCPPRRCRCTRWRRPTPPPPRRW